MLTLLIPLAPAVAVNELIQDFKYGFPEQCNREAPRPERFVIRDARREYCLLRELIDGSACSKENRHNTPTILAYAEQWTRGDFSTVSSDPEIRQKFSQLEGLQMYLYADRPCRFDSQNDFLDLRAAYSVYQAAEDNPQLREAFEQGQVGCILVRGLLGSRHHHGNASDRDISPHTHDLIFTSATVKLNDLPAETPTSDCLIIK